MNNRKLLRLAKKNHPMLIALSERWAKETDMENPVCIAREHRKFILLVCLSTASFIVFAILSAFELGSDSHSAQAWVYVTLSFISALVGMIVTIPHDCGAAVKPMKKFIRAISLIESIGENVWSLANQPEDYMRYLANLSERKLLKPFAIWTVNAEKIPWREKEAKKNKAEFEKRFDLLQKLLPVSRDRAHYFNN